MTTILACLAPRLPRCCSTAIAPPVRARSLFDLRKKHGRWPPPGLIQPAPENDNSIRLAPRATDLAPHPLIRISLSHCPLEQPIALRSDRSRTYFQKRSCF